MRIHSIQYLRGIAALMVVVYHLAPQIERMGLARPPGGWLMSGVDIFFVISGFIMWWTTENSPMTPGGFARRRIHRIVPLYWTLTAFYVAVLLLAPYLMQNGALDWSHTVASFLFVPYSHPVDHRTMPLLVLGWTLNYEMFFYFIFALCLFVRRTERLAVLGAALTGLVVLGALLQPESVAGRFYTSTYLLEFLAGVVLALLVGRGTLIPPRLVLPCIAAALLALMLTEDLVVGNARAFWMGIPAVIIVYAAVSYEHQRHLPEWPALLLLGNASYSLYLSQQITLSGAGQVWRSLFDGPHWQSAAAFAVFGTLVALAGGLACYRFVELPLARATKRFLLPLKDPMPVGAGMRSVLKQPNAS